jgi:hypothetical protein
MVAKIITLGKAVFALQSILISLAQIIVLDNFMISQPTLEKTL